jgi:hypothetical protein
MPNTIREVTREQFSDGTSADGNRLERMLADVVARVNGIRKGDKTRPRFPWRIVGGYMPSYSNQGILPFLPIFNTTGRIIGTAPVGAPVNFGRIKGTFNSEIEAYNAVVVDNQLAWSTTMFFPQPVTITHLYVGLYADPAGWATFVNNWQFGAGHPNHTNGDPSDDLIVDLAVDSPFSPENRAQTNSEIHKWGMKLNGHRFSTQATGAAFVDMLPPFAPNALYAAGNPNSPELGIAIDLRNLNIPIPIGSRVRLSIVIPQYRAGYASGWGALPVRSQYYNWKIAGLKSARS